MYLLDTNHCSRLLEGDAAVVGKLEELGDVLVATCVIVQGELVFMAWKSQRPASNLRRVEEFLRDIEVLPIDDETADTYGRLKAGLLDRFGPREKARRRRARIEDVGVTENDLWIAACSVRYGLTLVSSDSDFARLGQVETLPVENWLIQEPGGEADSK
jgi:tRNA(fMet)-specific endonuclease VapC